MSWRAAVVSILLGLVVTVLAELLGISERVSPIDSGVLSVLDNIWVRGGGIALIVATFVYIALYLIHRRRKKLRDENAPPVFTSRQPPNTVYDEIELEQFGVLWKGQYGTLRAHSSNRNNAYVSVQGPYCPYDRQKLKSRTVPKWIVFTEPAWVCPDCNNTYSRSTMHYLDEDNVVKDKMEQRFQQRASQQNNP